jgi:hypothetical protein
MLPDAIYVHKHKATDAKITFTDSVLFNSYSVRNGLLVTLITSS